MIDTGAIRKKILHLAVQGALTERMFDDGDATALLQAAKEDRALLLKDGIVKKEKPFPDIKDEQKRFDLPVGWTWCYLNEIAFVTKLAGFEYTKYIADAITTEGIPLFKGKNIQNSSIVLEFESFIPEEVSDGLKRSQLTRKCLLTPYVGTIGNIAIFDGSFKAHLGSNVGKIELFNYSGMHILEEYICYYLKSDYGYLELTKHKKATAQDSISIDAIRDVIVPLPPLAEQQRIVERVESIFSLLDEIDEAQAEYTDNNEQLKSKLIQLGLQGELTTQQESDGTAEDFIRNITTVPKRLTNINEEDIPFGIPDTWKWCRFSQLVDFQLGKTPERGNGQYWNDGSYPWISISDMPAGQEIFETKEKITEKALKDCFSHGLSKQGTLIMSFKLTIGRVSILGVDAVHNEAIISVYPRYDEDNIFRDYLMWVLPLVSQMGKAKGAIKGNTLNKDSISDLMIPLPPLAEQKRIVDKLNELLPLCS